MFITISSFGHQPLKLVFSSKIWTQKRVIYVKIYNACVGKSTLWSLVVSCVYLVWKCAALHIITLPCHVC